MAVTPKAPGTPDAPNSLTSDPSAQAVAPNSLSSENSGVVVKPASTTAKSEGAVVKPNATTSKSAGVVVKPASTTAKASNDAVAPNSLTSKSAGAISIPASTTSASAGIVVKPNSTTAKSLGSVGNPANTAPVSAVSAAKPNTLATEVASSPNAPSSLTSQVSSTIPRSLTPLVDMDFASQCYAQCGVGVDFADLFTYSRNSSATFINRRMNCGKWEYFLDTDYVGTVTNLITYSEQLDNAAWTKGNATVFANATTSNLTSGNAADKIIDDSTSGVHTVTSSTATVTSGSKVNISIYLKAGTENLVGLYEPSTAAGVLFDIKKGVVNSLFSTPEEYSITPAGNGYYRCTVTITSASTSASLRLYSKTFSAYVGSGEFYFATGAQITQSAKVLPYVSAVSSSTAKVSTESARFEYDHTTGEKLGYLSESAGTNILIESEDISSSTWTSAGSSIDKNTISAPDLTFSADKIIEDTTTSFQHRIDQTVNFVGTTQTFSVYAKAAERYTIKLRIGSLGINISFILSTGTITGTETDITPKIEYVDNGWYRCSISILNAPTGSQVCRVNLEDSTGAVTYNGDGSSGVYVWGAQAEETPFATSYIRTEGSAVSRASDLMFSSDKVNDSSGSVFIDARYNGSSSDLPGSRYAMQIDDGTSGERHIIINSGGNNSNSVGFSASVSQWVITGGPPSSEFVRVTETYDSSNIKLYADGVLTGNETSFTLPSGLKFIRVGSRSAGSNLDGHIKKLSIYDVALTAQEVALL